MGKVEPFESFRGAVLAEPDLQEKLRTIPDWASFVAVAVDAAAERGIALTADAVLAARQESRSKWLAQWP